MQQEPISFLNLVTKALRANFDHIANEPLPRRWVDLIHHLNERERMAADRQTPTPKQPQSH
jgi:hypothetical protein